jgi:stage II sporulation protein D
MPERPRRSSRARRISFALTVISLLAGGMQPAAEAQRKGEPSLRRVRIEAADGQTLLVHGTYPPVDSGCVGEDEQPLLHGRHRGAVEIRRSEDGSLFVIGELGFEDYVKGIAEVPPDWPIEAMKAQAVAARTYALSRLDPGGMYDLCATTYCQVYAGAGVELGPWGDRWARAVEATAGEALLYGGTAAQTFYFSTSNGRTYGNETVFGGSPLPYLRGIRERDDGASPLSHWRVEVPFEDLARFLTAAGSWSGRPIRRVSIEDGAFTIRGRRGRVALGKDGLRDALNETASCLAPARYPPTEPEGVQLPSTVPSIWYRGRVSGRALVLEGRGWGHGVGMVQWGAYGKARDGEGYDEILETYYGGLRPKDADVPATIRVLVATDLTSVTVAPAGDARISARGRRPEPPWTITGGRRLRVRPGDPPPVVLDVEGFRSAGRIEGDQRLGARVSLSDDAHVRVEVLDAGELAFASPWRPHHAGDAALRIPLRGLAPGRYEVRLAASDGVDTVRTDPRRLAVGGPASPSPRATTSRPRETSASPAADSGMSPWPFVGLGIGLLLIALLVIAARRRPRRP